MKKKKIVGHGGLLRRSALLAGAIGAFAASPALAAPTTSPTQTLTPPASVDGIPCTTETFTQALLSAGDTSWYTMLAGESPDNLTGAGWTLSNGASIASTTLADHTTGHVLNLPGGATATSPAICIDNGFQEARTEVKGDQGVGFAVERVSGTGWGAAQSIGAINSTGWGLSGEMNLNSNVPGWEAVRFVFTGGLNLLSPSAAQIYNVWVDPKMMH